MNADITSNADVVAADLAAAGVRAGARAVVVTRQFGQVLQTAVKRHASGRPGPRIITGNYNRSIGLRLGVENGSPTATVGTNAPQGRRLELGFSGTDSRGRTFAQAPFPHFGPALDEVAPLFVDALADAVDPT